jgi:hypothetical protein
LCCRGISGSLENRIFRLKVRRCVAVCSHGALEHTDVFDKVLVISPAQAEQFLRSRRSVRQFKDKPVDRDCPTASNSQLAEWVVLNDPKRLQVRSIAGQVDCRSGCKPLVPYHHLLVKAWDAGPCLVVAMVPYRIVDLILALSY